MMLGKRALFRPGDTIFKKGDPGDVAYIVEYGQLSVVINEREINSLGPGDTVGEMAIIDSQPRSATVTAATESSLLVISRDYFEEKIAASDPILKHFIQVLLCRIRYAERRALLPQAEELKLGREISKGDAYHRSQQEVIALLTLNRELQEGLKRKEFELFYQPIVRIGDGCLSGFEALIRWKHPHRGQLNPFSFINASEEAGMIIPMGNWVFETACEALHHFHQLKNSKGEKQDQLSMSVNLSYRQFFDNRLVETIDYCIARFRLPPQRITAELTESLFIDNPDSAATFLAQLRKRGIKIAVDDFGTGYASLTYLERFSPEVLKIDQSFIKPMGENIQAAAIVEALIQMAHKLNIQIIAEGVEGPEITQTLNQMGSIYAQGYFFSKPLGFDDACALIRSGHRWI
ncbi:MAG: EAL domain-containing protein [Gammaproteobacteria bacterium]|nr:EAL domain-containing protein [Gammaproteobacteria bacterium]